MLIRTFLALTITGLAASVPAQVQAFSGVEDRKVSRIFYYSRSDSGMQTHGQVAVDYGQPTWKSEYENDAFKENMKGQRWRFGSGPWTRLDTQVDLKFGDTEIAAGTYYLVIDYTEEGEMHLVFLDVAPIQEQKLDAFQAGQTKDGTKVPLEWVDDREKPAEKLEIEVKADPKEPTSCSLEVRFGPHELTADFTAVVE